MKKARPNFIRSDGPVSHQLTGFMAGREDLADLGS